MKKRLLLFFVVLLSAIVAFAQTNCIDKNFLNPPKSAKPITWMHVMSGNMSKEGLTKDCEALADAGIGGILLFNVTHNIPNGPVDFNSPEHIELTAHLAAECERLGLSFGIHNCDGWTSSGGPWVPVEHSMKQVVYRQQLVEGGKVDMRLPAPSACDGFYRDIATIAYPALKSEIEDAETHAILSCSNPDFDLNIATNGKIDERTELRVPVNGKAWIQWDFGKKVTVRSFLLKSENQRVKNNKFYLQTSEDGVNFKNIEELRINRHGKYFYTIDHVFDGITARYFRFETDFALDIAEVDLSSTKRFDNMILRVSTRRAQAQLPKIKDPGEDMIIKRESILNLTEFVDGNGYLRTNLPEGKWTIMRVGYTTTMAINDPASVVGTGYEVDKFSRESMKLFYDGHVKKVVNATKNIAPNAMQFAEIDSYEVGCQNWTKGYDKLFKEHLDYDITDFLPLYAGRFIDDAITTEGVLWDLRQLNSKLMVENYFDYFTELCHNDGLKSYVEPYGNGPFNMLDAARSYDIPMGEFHITDKYQTVEAVSAGHIYGKNIISAEAFTSGPKDNFNWHPAMFKSFGDKAFSMGINEICFHRFAHQANSHVKPGMTMSGFSSNIDRTQTWWDNAGEAWFKYLARAQYMLRLGIPHADLLVFVGDVSPNNTPSRQELNDLPNSINYDAVNADVLLNRIKVVGGKMVLPEGTNYQALYLSNCREMHLLTLKRISELAEQGVIIIGKKPMGIGGYPVSKKDKEQFDALVQNIWSKPTTIDKIDWEDIYNKNKLAIDLKIKDGENINYAHRKTESEDIYFFYNPKIKAYTYECTFNVDGKIPEWFDPMTGETSKLAAFEHVNGKTKVAVPMSAEGAGFVVFRENSEGVDMVNIATAINNPGVLFYLTRDNKLEIQSAKNGIFEIDFSNNSKKQISVNNIADPINIEGEWLVTFPDLKAGKQSFTFPSLTDWTKHEQEGVKHYSGTAIYEKSFNLDKSHFSIDSKMILDLGKVHEIARVIVNGKDLGVLWKAPHTVDISSVARAGINELCIELTNQWANRLIGDENFPNLTGYDLQPQLNKPKEAKDPHLTLINRNKMVDWYVNNEPAPLGQRSTFCTYPFYKKGDKLLPAGLLGTVKIRIIKTIK